MSRQKRPFLGRIRQRIAKFTDGIKAIFGPPAKDPAHALVVNQNLAQFVLTSGDFEEWTTEAYKKNEVVNRCLNLIINTLCEGSLGVYDSEGALLDTHPTHQILQHINPRETQKQFLRRLMLYMYLGDVGFIEKVFNRRGQLTELGLLRPDKVSIMTNSKYGVVRFKYTPSSEADAIELMPKEVLMMPFQDPVSRYSGFSPLKALAMRIDTDNEQTNHVMSVLQNGGVPGSILSVSDVLDTEQARALAMSFDQKTSGKQKGSTIVLHGGVEYENFGTSFKDLEAKELTKINEAKILAGLGVPLPVFGGPSGTDSSTYDNMRTALKIFWTQTVIPLQTMIEDFLNSDLDFISNADRVKGIRIKFNRTEVEALKEDQDMLSNRARLDYSGGIITLNEARVAGGYEPIPEGDMFYSPFPSFDLPTSEETRSSAILDKSAATPSLLEDDHGGCGCCHKDEPLMAGELGDQTVNEAIENQKLKKRLYEFEIATKRMKLADAFVFDLFKLARKHLTKHIADVQNLIGEKDVDADDLVTKQIDKSRIEQGLLDLKQAWLVSLTADSLKTVPKLMEAAAEQASLSVGSSFSMESAAVREVIAAQQFKFARGISDTSADQIRKVLLDSFAEGKSVKELRKDIQKLGDHFTQNRAATIARTETVRAANQGAKLGYREAGVTKLRYSAVLDGNTTEICEHLDGKIVGIDEKFFSETSFTLSNGKVMDLGYDQGVPEPPAHPNCRSTIIPEIDDGF